MVAVREGQAEGHELSSRATTRPHPRTPPFEAPFRTKGRFDVLFPDGRPVEDPDQLKLLAYICCRVGRKGKAMVGTPRMAKDLRWCERKTKQIRYRLQDAGVLHRTRRFNDTNIYTVLVPFLVSEESRSFFVRRRHRARQIRGLFRHKDWMHTKELRSFIRPCRCPYCRRKIEPKSGGSRSFAVWWRDCVRPRGPDWQEQLARKARRKGYDATPILHMEHRLDPLPPLERLDLS